MHFGKHSIILAPLAGVTDTVFRRLCRELGADIVVSEMVSAEGIFRGSRGSIDLMRFNEAERPVGIQLFGADAGRLAWAAAWVQDNIRPDFIDLNAGCPVPKVSGANGGAGLLRDRHLFEQIVTAMAKALHIPLTVKIRCGWTVDELVDTTYARITEQAGAAAVTLHARTRSMLFSGQAMWERIALTKAAVSIPVIGNGDIRTPADALAMVDQTGCDSVMVGRAGMGNPLLFRMIRQAFDGKPVEPVPVTLRLATALRHLEQYRRVHGERKAAAEMKKQVAWYFKGIAGSAGLRDRAFRAQQASELKSVLEEGLAEFAETGPGADRARCQD